VVVNANRGAAQGRVEVCSSCVGLAGLNIVEVDIKYRGPPHDITRAWARHLPNRQGIRVRFCIAADPAALGDIEGSEALRIYLNGAPCVRGSEKSGPPVFG